MVAAAILALVGAWMASIVLPLDLNLTDGGFILGQSHRLLAGEWPHADFITPRPAGSPYLHTLDFALPGPVFAASRVVIVAEVVAYSALLGLLVLRTRLGALGAAALAGIAASALVNLHAFPPIPWHTIDGLLLAAAGLVALERALVAWRPAWWITAALLLGAAPLTKQSFFAVPLLGLARLALARVPLPRAAGFALVMAAPGIAYVAAVSLAGGFGEMIDQLFGAIAVWGEPLWQVLYRSEGAGDVLPAVVTGALLIAAVQLVGPEARPVAGAALRLALSGLVLWVALSDELSLFELWSFELFWLAVATFAAVSLARRELDWPGLAVVALGWMVSLSYGAPRPAFAGGTLALYVLARAWEGWAPPRRLPAAAPAVAALAAAAAAGFVFWDERSQRVELLYRDEDVLTARLGAIDPDLRGLRSDPATAQYLADVRECVERHPARWTAIVPEDAVSPVAFDLRNPLPMDWLWPPEYRGDSRGRIVAAAREAARRGDYLFLFQTVPAGVMQGERPTRLPAAPPDGGPPPFPFDASLSAELAAQLDGRRVGCGSLSGFWSPRPAATAARAG